MKPMLEDPVALYGAIVATLVAIPTIRDIWKIYFESLRIICIDFTRNDVERGKEGMGIYHQFEISIVNTTKETRFLSHVSLELKNKKRRTIVTLNSFTVNNEFKNKLEVGEYMKEVVYYEDRFLKNNVDKYVSFDEYRVLIEGSQGKYYKSKWYKSEIFFNENTVKWVHRDKHIVAKRDNSAGS